MALCERENAIFTSISPLSTMTIVKYLLNNLSLLNPINERFASCSLFMQGFITQTKITFVEYFIIRFITSFQRSVYIRLHIGSQYL